MIYELVKGDKKLHIFLKGHLTFSDCLIFRELTEHVRNENNVHYLIDLSELDFIDTAGLGMLILARDTIAQKNAKIQLKGLQGQVEKMLHFSQLNHLFSVI